jgi:hypothetical protein
MTLTVHSEIEGISLLTCCLHRNLRDARLHVLDERDCIITSEYEFHRCLVSEHIEVYPERKRYIHLPKDIAVRHTNVLFRNDLYDCNIEICTPEVFCFA